MGTRLPAFALVALGLTALAGCSGPSAREVQEESRDASRAAVARIEPALEPIGAAGELVGRRVVDSCRTGQHNWKIDDPYDVVCTVAVFRAYLVQAPRFRDAADRVHATMPGCATGETSAERMLRGYWDKLEGTTVRNFPGPYRPDFLPGYRFGCAERTPTAETEPGVTGWVTVPVDDVARRQREYGFGTPCEDGGTAEEPCVTSGDRVEDVWERVADRTGWVVLVVTSTEYVEKG